MEAPAAQGVCQGPPKGAAFAADLDERLVFTKEKIDKIVVQGGWTGRTPGGACNIVVAKMSHM
jgi:hypothetical protein